MLHAEAGGENDELDFEGAVFPEDAVLVLALGESVPGDPGIPACPRCTCQA